MRGREVSLFGVLFWFFIFAPAYSAGLNGSVQEDSFVQGKSSKVIDSATGLPVGNAKVSIPAKGISAFTDSHGDFKLNADINGPAILSVQKNGYRPFSLTVTDNSFSKPFILSIDKQAANQLVIDMELRHLGDDNYSTNSANASDFKAESVGPSFSKKFFLKNIKNNQKASVVIGSVVGLDTLMAKQLHQNKLTFAYASPAEIFVNGEKVGE
ncbi:MAG: carboxypeptidase-like regulatory domain-containing protein, partial [Candidatus Gastranaerophilaceae bacterium]